MDHPLQQELVPLPQMSLTCEFLADTLRFKLPPKLHRSASNGMYDVCVWVSKPELDSRLWQDKRRSLIESFLQL